MQAHIGGGEGKRVADGGGEGRARSAKALLSPDLTISNTLGWTRSLCPQKTKGASYHLVSRSRPVGEGEWGMGVGEGEETLFRNAFATFDVCSLPLTKCFVTTCKAKPFIKRAFYKCVTASRREVVLYTSLQLQLYPEDLQGCTGH